MEDPTMLEFLGMIRNVQPQMGNVDKDENIPQENQQLQPALYQLNLIKDSLQKVPADNSSFSGLQPCREHSSLPQCSEQSGLPQCSEQSSLPPCSVQSGLLPCRAQSGLPPFGEQSHLPLCSDQSHVSQCSEQSGLPQCSEQSDIKVGISCQSGSAIPGHSFINDNTCPNQTGIISTCTSGEGHPLESFQGQPLTETKNSFLISQIAYVAHRVQPNQEYEYAITKHKIMDILNSPFMCGICGNIFKTTKLLRIHVIKDHCLNIPPENGGSDRWEGGVTGSETDQKPKKQEENLGNISDAACVDKSENKPTGQQMTVLENSTSFENKTCVNLKDTYKPSKKMDRQSRRKGNRKRTHLDGESYDTTNIEKSMTNEISSGKKNRHSVKEDGLDSDKIEGKLKEVEDKTKDDKRFQCEFCEELFTSNRYRFKHRVASHPDCMFACPNCDRTFQVHEKDKWQHHVRIHNKPPKKPKQDSYSCHVCSMVFRAASSVAIHTQTFHPENVKVEKPFCCEVCGKLFRTKRAIKLHQTLVHSDKKPYECPTCGRGFKMESYLKLHLRTHTGEKPFACKFCDKTFPSTAGRRSHERTHTNERPYKCSYCDRRFKAKPQLVEHVRTHTKEKPFVCPVCGKAFASRTSFATHKFLHTGKKPFQCSSCSRAFAQKCNLEHHVRSIHTQEKPHQCNICGVRFSRSTGRSMHMEKKHGIKVSLKQGRPLIYPEAQEMDHIVQAGCVSIDVSSGIMGPTMLEDTLSLVVESLNG